MVVPAMLLVIGILLNHIPGCLHIQSNEPIRQQIKCTHRAWLWISAVVVPAENALGLYCEFENLIMWSTMYRGHSIEEVENLWQLIFPYLSVCIGSAPYHPSWWNFSADMSCSQWWLLPTACTGEHYTCHCQLPSCLQIVFESVLVYPQSLISSSWN